MRDGLRHILEARGAPWLIVALTLLITLPSIQLDFYNDDLLRNINSMKRR